MNTGVLNCETEYFGFLDSDDYYCRDTVKKFLQAFSEIENNDSVAGILARRGKSEDEVIGTTNLPKGRYIENFDVLIRKYNFYGDTCRAYKTNILKQYLYPEIKDKFILESVMLSKIDQKYNLLIINEVFSISSYLLDGYTKNSFILYNRNPYGYALGMGIITAAKRGFLRQIKYTITFTVWCKIHNIKNSYEIVENKKLYLLCLPLSLFCYIMKYPNYIFKGNKNE